MPPFDYQKTIDHIFAQVKKLENPGKIATYIPELGNVNPDKFGVCLHTINGENYFAGDSEEPFSIQSIAKVLSLVLAYKNLGEDLWKRVGVEPSGNPFNSLVQLEYDEGIPRNPLINAGAMVVCDVLISLYENPISVLLDFIRDITKNPRINIDSKIANSEKITGFRNHALAYFLKSFKTIENDCDEVLDFYFKLCSITMSCKELAETFMFLGNGGKNIRDGSHIISARDAKRINGIMMTCGFYDEAGEFSYRVGLPGKSGVGGGIVAIDPGNFSIGVWSPRLNQKGNSYLGIRFLSKFFEETGFSVF